VWSATGDALPQYQPHHEHALPPLTFADALREQDQAVVVTTATAPHRIVHVNAAWERLCGYTKQEALHQSLTQLIQGRDTNAALAERTVRAVTSHAVPIKDMYLVNYKKNGSPFKNHVTLAPCRMEMNRDQSVELLVGVLEEVERVPLRMV